MSLLSRGALCRQGLRLAPPCIGGLIFFPEFLDLALLVELEVFSDPGSRVLMLGSSLKRERSLGREIGG
jgi:hypothetical protein